MLLSMVPGNIVGCCETIATTERSVGVCRSRMSTPPSEMAGTLSEAGVSSRANSRAAMVDLPEPERPTIAVHEFSGMVKETSFRTGVSGRDGYWKFNLVIFTGVGVATRKYPRRSWEAPARFASCKSLDPLSRDTLICGTGKVSEAYR